MVAHEKLIFNKDLLLNKASKRSPWILTMMVLLFAMVCGVLIYSLSIKQLSIFRQTDPFKIQVIDRRERLCKHTRMQELNSSDAHFPIPKTFSRQECACNPVRFFAIVTMQRSGSGWFETLLNSHVNISSNGEIFGSQDRRTNVSALYQTLDRVYDLDWFSSASKNECSAAVGFKWMLNQGLMAYHKEVSDYFRKHQVSMIFLLRRNLLRRFISLVANKYDKEVKLLNGTHKSHVHTLREAQVLASYKPALNTTMLLSDLRSAEGTVAKALERFKTVRHIVVYYEDIVSNRTKLVDVLEFLKLPAQNLTSLQVKIHSGSLSELISNFDTVEKTLKGTLYEHYLYTDYNL
ncbi:uncharacterized protein LOC127246376 [Andrographis paniculata]|uniref:uncharacterized protein LOC127246376 n=1 Tax=Andrographis paniculata TaxID=175694 RepID=UPI0021E86429|nr:uncharacterized protein LOC127246376 [Andrographis paniculata]